MKLTGWQTAHANVWCLAKGLLIFTPSNTNFGGKFSDVFVVFKVSPKFNARAGLFG